MLLPPPCMLSAAMHIAIVMHVTAAMYVAATGHVYHCYVCCLWPCMSLLGPQYSHIIYRKKKLVKTRKTKNKNTPKSCFVIFVAITKDPKLLALKPQPEPSAPALYFLGPGLSL